MSPAADLLQQPPHLSRLSADASARHLALVDALKKSSLGSESLLIGQVAKDLELAIRTCSRSEAVAAYPLLLILMASECELLGVERLAHMSECICYLRPLLDSVRGCLSSDEGFKVCRGLLCTVVASLHGLVATYISTDSREASVFLPEAVKVLEQWAESLGSQRGVPKRMLALVLDALLKASGASENERTNRAKVASSVQLLIDLTPFASTEDCCALTLTVLTKVILRGSPKIGKDLALHIYTLYLSWLGEFCKTQTSLPQDTREFLNTSFEMMMMASTESGIIPVDGMIQHERFMIEAFGVEGVWDGDRVSKSWSSDVQVQLLCMYFSLIHNSRVSVHSTFHQNISTMAIGQLKRICTPLQSHNNPTPQTIQKYRTFICAYLRHLAQAKSNPVIDLTILPYLIDFGIINELPLTITDPSLSGSLQSILLNSESNQQANLIDRTLHILLPQNDKSDLGSALAIYCFSYEIIGALCEHLCERYKLDVSLSARQRSLAFSIKCLRQLCCLLPLEHTDFLIDHQSALGLSGHTQVPLEGLLLHALYMQYLPQNSARLIYPHLLPLLLDALKADDVSQTLANIVIATAANKWACPINHVTAAYWELVADYLKRRAESDQSEKRQHLARIIESDIVSSAIPRAALCGIGRYVCSIIRGEKRVEYDLLDLLRAILSRVNSLLDLENASEEDSGVDEEIGGFVGERRLADVSLAVTQGVPMTQSGFNQLAEVSLDCVLQALRIHTRCPRSLYSRLKQAWTAICAGVKYPTATYNTVDKCLQIIQTCGLAFAADFTFSLIRNEFLPDVLKFLRSCQSSELREEGRIKRLGERLFDLLHSISQASSTCDTELVKMLSKQELDDLQERWQLSNCR